MSSIAATVPIFRDEPDRQRFLETLGDACGKTGWQVHAWCLMGIRQDTAVGRRQFELLREERRGRAEPGEWGLGVTSHNSTIEAVRGSMNGSRPGSEFAVEEPGIRSPWSVGFVSACQASAINCGRYLGLRSSDALQPRL